MKMQFDHILEAILYAQLTGDQDSLETYVGEHLDKMAQIVKNVDKSLTNDDLYFYLAFMKPWINMRMSMLEESERDLVDMLSSSIQMVGVKVPAEMLRDGDESDAPPKGPLS